MVSLRALGTGLLNDDYCHRALLIGPSEFTGALAQTGLMPEGSGHLSAALSDQFITVDPRKNLERLKAYGALPWWMCDELRVAFWRPVTSLTHWADHRLFPNSIKLMHFHNILWFAALIFALTVLYRQVAQVGSVPAPGGSVKAEGLGDGSTASERDHRQAARDDATLRNPPWIGGLAALMYLLADFSYFPTMWVANRNILLSGFFGVWALILHDRCRSGWGRLGWWAAPACLLLSVLSGEAGIATGAYLLAYELILRREPWAQRVRAFAPFVAVIVGWRMVYNILGYGASGGGFYLDPVREPIRYALAVLDRAPFLLAGQWTTLPPEFHSMLSGVSKQLLAAALLLFVVGIPLAVWPLLRANRRACFWVVGMYLSALPVCATAPMGRALVFIAMGAFGLVAELLDGWWRKADWVPIRRGQRGLIFVLVVLSVVLHLPAAAARRAMAPKVAAKLQRKITKTMAIGLLRWGPNQDLVIVNAPNPAALFFDPFRNAYRGSSLPEGVRVLAPAFGDLEVVRTQPHRLVVRAVSGSLLDCAKHGWLHLVFFYRTLSDVRGPDQPMQAGQRLVLPRMSVEVLRVDEHGLPVEAAFDFAVALEDPALRWLYWDWQERDYALFRVPEVGGRVTLKGPF